jgi:hypothetical protein
MKHQCKGNVRRLTANGSKRKCKSCAKVSIPNIFARTLDIDRQAEDWEKIHHKPIIANGRVEERRQKKTNPQ